MGALSAATLARAGIAELAVANRSPQRAQRLVAQLGGQARAVSLDAVADELVRADVVIGCTGAVGIVLPAATVEAALPARAGRSLVLLDLALPRDFDGAAGALPGVHYLDLAALQEPAVRLGAHRDVERARQIVGQEVSGRLGARRATAVTPTVTALRARAAEVVDTELARLDARLPGPGRGGPGRGRAQRAPGRADPAARPDRTGQGAGRAARRRSVRGRAAGAVRPRPGRHRGGRGPRAADRGRPAVSSLRIGTRGSALARSQTSAVIAALAALGVKAEAVEIVTTGDRSSAALTQIGGTGVFVSALRDALLAGEIDVAVHSYKDLPTAAAPGLVVAAVPLREDPRDVLVARDGLTLGELPPGAVIGTGAPRRAAQIRALGLGVELVPIRGNVDTRLGKVSSGELDAVVLARAGLARLDRLDAVTETLDPLLLLPAPAQGALAVECRASDGELVAQLAALDHADSRAAVLAERALLAALEAGCTAPVGGLAVIAEGEYGPELFLRGSVTAADGSDAVRLSATGPVTDAQAIGRRLAADLLADGANDLLGSTR